MSQDINESHFAMLRGVKNCGGHHEENRVAPAIQFAQECDCCAGLIFMTIWNAGVDVEAKNAVMIVRRHR